MNIIGYDELVEMDWEHAGDLIGRTYILALDTVSHTVVRVYRNAPLPPRCFKVLAVRVGNWSVVKAYPYHEDGALRSTFFTLPRWHDQRHVRHMILRGDPASPGAGDGSISP